MSNINQKVLDVLIKLLIKFIERKTGILSIKNLSNAELIHYYYYIQSLDQFLRYGYSYY